jgi:thioredoxin 1
MNRNFTRCSRIVLSVLLLSVVSNGVPAQDDNSGIRTWRDSATQPATPDPRTPVVPDGWPTNLDSALARSQENGRTLVAYFAGWWAPPCQSMREEVLGNPKVTSALHGFEKVAIDIDNQKDLAKEYDIRELPTFVIFDNAGKELDRFTGYLPPEAFVETLRAAADPRQSPSVLSKRIESDPEDVEARWLLAQKDARDRDRTEMRRLLAEIRRIDPENASGYLDHADYLDLMTSVDVSKPDDSIRNAERFLSKYPHSEYQDQVDLMLAQLYIQQDDQARGIRILEEFPARHPDSPLAAQVAHDLADIRAHAEAR